MCSHLEFKFKLQHGLGYEGGLLERARGCWLSDGRLKGKASRQELCKGNARSLVKCAETY